MFHTTSKLIRNLTLAALLVAASAPLAAADPAEFDCRTYPPALQYATLCTTLVTGHTVYHCGLLIGGDAAGFAITTVLYVITNLGPMVQELKCQSSQGINEDIGWWNDTWIHTGRAAFCFAMGPSPNACPTSPNGVYVQTLNYASCTLTPGHPPLIVIRICSAPTLPPPPPVWIPGPPPYP